MRLPDRSQDIMGSWASPRYAPRILQQFGKNCWGEAMYRLVWSPSRYQLVGGHWSHLGKCAYIPCPLYTSDGRWVLEKWQPCSIAPDEWNTRYAVEEGYLAIGPYPVYGEYYECFWFTMGGGLDGFIPMEPSMLMTAAMLVDMGKHTTYTDNRIAARDRMKDKDRAWEQMIDAEWDDAQHVREGLSIGAGGAVDPSKEYEEYERNWRKQRGLTDKLGLQQL